MVWAALAALLLHAWQVEHSLLRLQPGDSLELTLQNTSWLQLDRTLDGSGQALLLVEQLGIDAELSCPGMTIGNAPTGRIGAEAVLLELPRRCRLTPRVANSPAAPVRISLHLAEHELPAGPPAAWRLYQQANAANDGIDERRPLALAHFQQLLQHEEIGPLLRLPALLGAANLLRRTGRQPEALTHYVQANQLAEQAGYTRWLAVIENAAGQSWLAAHDLAEAQRAFESALLHAQQHADAYQLAAATNNLCLVDHYRGRLRVAADCYQRAVDAYQAAGESVQIAVALMNWAAAAQELGDAEAALLAFDRAIGIRRQEPSGRSLALTLMNSASLHAQLAQWPQALANSAEALGLFERLGQPDDIARALHLRARLFVELGRTDRAEPLLQRGLQLVRDRRLRGLLLAVRADLGGEDGEGAQREALAIFREVGAENLALRHQIELARLQLSRGETVLAREQADRAARAIESIGGLRLRGRLALLQAELAAAAGDHDAALLAASRAIDMARELQELDALQDALLQQTELALASGRALLARRALEEALQNHTRILARMPATSLSAAYVRRRARWKDLYLQSLDIDRLSAAEQAIAWQVPDRFHAAGDALPSAGEATALRSYRLLASRLQAIEDPGSEQGQRLRTELERLESQLELTPPPSLAARPVSKPPTAATEVIDRLQLRFLVGQHQGLGLWRAAGATGAFRLPGRAQLEQTLLAAAVDPVARVSLGRLLLASAPQPAGGWQRIEVLSDGLLHRIPFPALARAAFGDPAPAIVLWGPYSESSTSHVALPSDFSAAIVRLPGQGTGLPGVAREQQRLLRSLGARAQLVDDWSGVGELRLPAVDLIHLAAHGWTDPERPWAPALSADPPSAATSTPPLLLVDQLRFQQPPQLVLLNACDAAAGDDYDSGMNLATQIAARSGAIVVAPVEAVDDALAMRFGQQLLATLPGHDAATAVARTLVELTDEYDARWPPWQVIQPRAVNR